LAPLPSIRERWPEGHCPDLKRSNIHERSYRCLASGHFPGLWFDWAARLHNGKSLVGRRFHRLLLVLAVLSRRRAIRLRIPSYFVLGFSPNMKKSVGSTLLLAAAIGAIGLSIVENPPGGVRWWAFVEDSSPWWQKVSYLINTYVLPGLLSCIAISAFQLQSRVAASGANKRIVFTICLLASGTMLTALRWMAFSPSTTATSYVAGMALGYTVMSRLYAVRMRLFFGRVRLPWPVWRGNVAAVREIDELARMRRGAAPTGM
jgi:hypothetical protein